MTTVAPNPHSPYADASPEHRHIFPSPIFFPAPKPGVLALTACEGMAVVPKDLIQTEPGAALPDGLCPACVTVMQGGKPPKRPSSQCGECGTATWHGVLCALCRQDKHEAWWPTRDQQAAEGQQLATQEAPAAVLLSTRCDACRHTLNWHRNDVGCTVALCVCGAFQQPVEELPQ